MAKVVLGMGTPHAPFLNQREGPVAERWAPSGRLVFAQEAVEQSGEYVLRPHFSPGLGNLSGFINAPIDADGVVRRFRPVLPGHGGTFVPSFALAAAAASGGIGAADLARDLHAGVQGALRLPVTDRAGRVARVEPVRLGRAFKEFEAWWESRQAIA